MVRDDTALETAALRASIDRLEKKVDAALEAISIGARGSMLLTAACKDMEARIERLEKAAKAILR